MTEQSKQNKPTWNFSLFQVAMLKTGAFLMGVHTSILIYQPNGESVIGSATGILVAIMILFNVLYAAKKRMQEEAS